MAKRDFLKMQVSPGEKERFEKLYIELGMSQIEATTRLVRWFLGQSDVIQGEVLGTAPKSTRPDVAKMILERMAGSTSKRKPEYKKNVGLPSQSAATPEGEKPTREKSTPR